MHVLHAVHTFLPVTENWVYSQIRFNTSCQSSVLCRFRDNRETFPHGRVRSLYPGKGVFAALDALAERCGDPVTSAVSRRAIDGIRPDVVHGHFAYESCRHLAPVRTLNLPLVTTFYGIDISKLPRHRRWRLRYAKLFEYGAAFIVEGPFMAEKLAALGCPSGKIHCVPIGVDRAAIRGAVPFYSDAAVHVLFTGLGREKKGALDAVQAFVAVASKRPGCRLDLVGGGRFRPEAERVLGQAGLLDRCTFHGSVPVATYLRLLKSSGVVLAPSVTASDGDTEGGAPVTTIEAQAAGVPVVGTTHCDIPFVVKNGLTGLLCGEHDVPALSANLEKLVTDAGLRKKMGEAAAQHAAEQHDIKNQVGKITRIYTQALSK